MPSNENSYESTHSGIEIDTGIDNSATHIASTANPHSVTKEQVGLGNVDNTADADKPVSSATQTALDAKVPNTRTVNSKALSADIELDKTDVGLGNCDNTSDADKPISTAVQTALNGKQNTITVSASAPSGGSDGDIWLQVGE